MELPSKLLEKAVSYFESLPGVGRRTALRYTLQLLKMQKEEALNFGASMIKLVEELGFCSICHNVSDGDVCQICAHPLQARCQTVHFNQLRRHPGQFAGI